jgi:2-aminoethylphosphonate dioxygenase
VADLLGEPAVLFKDKINLKLPGGDGFEPHQDQQAGWSAYAPLFVTALVSIDESTEANGCLELAAGHHARGLIGREWAPLAGPDLAGVEFRPCPTKPGDALFFDSYVPHRSGPNLSEEPRRVLYVTYNRLADGDHRARYYADKRRAYPPDVEREPGTRYVYRV